MLKIATWNVNSLKVRLDQVLAWLATSSTDVLALQETKVSDDCFPLEIFLNNGYFVHFSGQKTYNGTAIISRIPLKDPLTDLQNFTDPQRRILAVTLENNIRLINLYVPNGASLDSEKYQYKLNWLMHVTSFIQGELQKYPYVAVVGDFNIAPSDVDVHDPLLWSNDILVSPPERQAFTNLLELGLIDSFRMLNPTERVFSWWDYRAAGFRRNHGLRIDHILLSASLAAQCIQCEIDIEPRKDPRPSDHAPVWISLNV